MAARSRDLSLSGSHDVEVEAGNHHVEMYVAWALPARMGPAQIDVSLQDRDTVRFPLQAAVDPDQAGASFHALDRVGAPPGWILLTLY